MFYRGRIEIRNSSPAETDWMKHLPYFPLQKIPTVDEKNEDVKLMVLQTAINNAGLQTDDPDKIPVPLNTPLGQLLLQGTNAVVNTDVGQYILQQINDKAHVVKISYIYTGDAFLYWYNVVKNGDLWQDPKPVAGKCFELGLPDHEEYANWLRDEKDGYIVTQA